MTAARPWKVPIRLTLALCTAFLLFAGRQAFATANADISVTKGNDTGGSAVAGATVTYTITVTNNGPSGASQVVITDFVGCGGTTLCGSSFLTNVVVDSVTQPSQCTPSGTNPITLNCNMQGLGASGSINTIVFHATVDPSTPKDTVIQNCAFRSSSNSNDPNGDNDAGCDNGGFTVTELADLAVTKTQTSPDPAVVTSVPGATNVTYHIVATNNGPSAATNFAVTDQLTSGAALFESLDNVSAGLDCSTNTNTAGNAFVSFTCTDASLANGDSVSFDLTLQVPNDGTTSITNQASVTSDTTDNNTDDNTSSVTTPICQSVDLAVSKACQSVCPVGAAPTPKFTCPVDITEIQGGNNFQYTITVTNNDASVNATNVVVTDTLPAGVDYVSDDQSCDTSALPTVTCSTSSIAAGGGTFTVHIVVKAVQSGSSENSASASADQCDRNTEDNTSSCSVTILTNNMPTALEADREGCSNGSSPFCTGDDDSVATDSDVNRVFEPNETVRVDPAWTNTLDNADADETGTASALTGPGDGTDATYTILDSTADYGAIPAHAQSDCNGITATSPDSTGTGDCYEFQILQNDSNVRPHNADHPRHWDAQFLETLNSGETHTWQLHMGDSFTDVPHGDIFYRVVETIFHNHITVGCGDGTLYCPFDFTSRGQMAAFVDRAILGSDSLIPVSIPTEYDCSQGSGSGGFTQFDDVAPGPLGVGNDFCRHIGYLKHIKLTNGCFDTSHFCPGDTVTRGQMAVFVAAGMEVVLGNTADPGGSVPQWKQNATDNTNQYNCTASDQQDPDTLNTIPAMTGPFLDVAWNDALCKFIGFLKVNNVVVGDGAGHYLPGNNIARDETAAILAGAFVNIPLYGPAFF